MLGMTESGVLGERVADCSDIDGEMDFGDPVDNTL